MPRRQVAGYRPGRRDYLEMTAIRHTAKADRAILTVNGGNVNLVELTRTGAEEAHARHERDTWGCRSLPRRPAGGPQPQRATVRSRSVGPLVIPSLSGETGGAVISGSDLVIGDWPASGTASEVAPLHVHHGDDEAWHVISGALRFRFIDREVTVGAGSSVLVPAGVAHTFGNAGPATSRFIIILSKRLDELIARLHETDPCEHLAIYEQYTSQLLE